MPGFKDCLASARDQGAITDEEAGWLGRRFDEEFAQARLELGDGAAAAAAKERLTGKLRAEAREGSRRVLLADAARRRLKDELFRYRNSKGEADVFSAAMFELSGYGTAGFSSMRGRAEAIIGLAQARLADHISAFRRDPLTGRYGNRPLADDVTDALHGAATGSAEARALAEGLAEVAEELRQRFNAAGGAIGRIDDWGWRHVHERSAVAAAGRDSWKDFVRPLLDPARMRHHLTGAPLNAAELEDALDAVHESIVSAGWARHRPQMRPAGRGAVAGRRGEERFLVFRNGGAWREYDARFGIGDPVAAWFEHVNAMARDIAAMEAFGPNPDAMVDWMKQVVRAEIGKAQAGRPGAAIDRIDPDAGDFAAWRIDSLYAHLRGRQTVSSRVAELTGDVRNLMTAALLGASSMLAAATDPFIDMAARRLAGLPAAGALKAVLHTFSRGTRDQAVRAGFMMDDFLHVLKDEARFAGQLNGGAWSRWIADRSLAWSLLKPMTQARRHLFALEWQAALADHAGQPLEALPRPLAEALQGAGIDRTDWDVMRATPLFRPGAGSAAFLRPSDVAALADSPALPMVQQLLGIDAADAAEARRLAAEGARRTAEKYVEMVTNWTERAVPSGTPNARSFVTGTAPRGSLGGELLEGLLQFKSFGLSFTTLQWQAMQIELTRGGRAGGAAYAGSLAIGMTLGGALYLQLKAIVDGRDPQDMSDGRFWAKAAASGGGFGIFGDFLFADYARSGHNPLTTLGGPGMSFAVDAADLTVGSAFDLAQGEDPAIGRKATNFLRRYTPVASTHWALRGAYNRVLLDQLQYLTDPQAHRSLRARERAAQAATGQRFFWRPGEAAPGRPPDLAAALGE